MMMTQGVGQVISHAIQLGKTDGDIISFHTQRIHVGQGCLDRVLVVRCEANRQGSACVDAIYQNLHASDHKSALSVETWVEKITRTDCKSCLCLVVC